MFHIGLLLALFSLQSSPALAKEPNWSYDGSKGRPGPDAWGTIEGDELCSTGKEQSPVDIVTSAVTENPTLPRLDFHYQPVKLNLENTGRTIQMDFSAGPQPSTLVIGDHTYKLKQFHFHASSENTLNGKHFPLELHFVHVNEEGKHAVVVAVFIAQGKHNAKLDSLFQNFPAKTGQIIMDARVQIDPRMLLPKDTSYYSYDGSATVPPCKEGLHWYVLDTPIELDAAQIRSYTGIPGFAHTHRAVQPLNARKIEKLKTSS